MTMANKIVNCNHYPNYRGKPPVERFPDVPWYASEKTKDVLFLIILGNVGIYCIASLIITVLAIIGYVLGYVQ